METTQIFRDNPEMELYLKTKKQLKNWSIFELEVATVHGTTHEVREAAKYLLKERNQAKFIQEKEDFDNDF